MWMQSINRSRVPGCRHGERPVWVESNDASGRCANFTSSTATVIYCGSANPLLSERRVPVKAQLAGANSSDLSDFYNPIRPESRVLVRIAARIAHDAGPANLIIEC